MTQEQALSVIVSVCEKANKSGLFTLSESSLVLQALQTYGVTPPEVESVEQNEKKTESETKKVKD